MKDLRLRVAESNFEMVQEREGARASSHVIHLVHLILEAKQNQKIVLWIENNPINTNQLHRVSINM